MNFEYKAFGMPETPSVIVDLDKDAEGKNHVIVLIKEINGEESCVKGYSLMLRENENSLIKAGFNKVGDDYVLCGVRYVPAPYFSGAKRDGFVPSVYVIKGSEKNVNAWRTKLRAVPEGKSCQAQ